MEKTFYLGQLTKETGIKGRILFLWQALGRPSSIFNNSQSMHSHNHHRTLEPDQKLTFKLRTAQRIHKQIM